MTENPGWPLPATRATAGASAVLAGKEGRIRPAPRTRARPRLTGRPPMKCESTSEIGGQRRGLEMAHVSVRRDHRPEARKARRFAHVERRIPAGRDRQIEIDGRARHQRAQGDQNEARVSLLLAPLELEHDHERRQEHRIDVAVADRETDGQPGPRVATRARRLYRLDREEQREHQQDHVERVNLGGQGLGPERLTDREAHGGHQRAEAADAQAAQQQPQHRDGGAAASGREEVRAIRDVTDGKHAHEEPGEQRIERISRRVRNAEDRRPRSRTPPNLRRRSWDTA